MKSAEKRRSESNEYIKAHGIECLENLPVVPESNEIKLKNSDDICKKFLSTLIAVQVACDINRNDYEESIKFFKPILNRFGVEKSFNTLEKKIFDGKCSNKDVINCTWEYEILWSLAWALGFVDDIKDASDFCDCSLLIRLVAESETYEEFKNKCTIRDIEEILDMLDLYYRYDWAVTEKRINSSTPVGNLNSEIVTERRRGLEWLICSDFDWFDISLDT